MSIEGPEGNLRFHLALEIQAEEMRLWKPEYISSFLRGIAATLQAVKDGRQSARDSASGVDRAS